jgi:hypothetical protein
MEREPAPITYKQDAQLGLLVHAAPGEENITSGGFNLLAETGTGPGHRQAAPLSSAEIDTRACSADGRGAGDFGDLRIRPALPKIVVWTRTDTTSPSWAQGSSGSRWHVR